MHSQITQKRRMKPETRNPKPHRYQQLVDSNDWRGKDLDFYYGLPPEDAAHLHKASAPKAPFKHHKHLILK